MKKEVTPKNPTPKNIPIPKTPAPKPVHNPNNPIRRDYPQEGEKR